MAIKNEPPYSYPLEIAAEAMGLSLLGRYDLARIAEHIECTEEQAMELVSTGELRKVRSPTSTIKVFGREIVNYLLGDIPVEQIVEYSPPIESRMLKIGDVTFITSLSRSTIDRLEYKGQFPKRVKLGPNRVAWNQDDVLLWLSQRPKKSEF